MTFVIDTSSALTGLALIDPSGEVTWELLPSRSPELIERMRALPKQSKLTKVAVATGPGSFTGLRVGASFGLGLAMGLRIPIIPLPTLELQVARSDSPVLAVSEAGRGRVYYQVPGGKPALGDPYELPKDHEVVGWLRPATERALLGAGLRFRSEAQLRSFGEAARRVLEKAHEVAYGSLKLEYMQSFSRHK